MAHIHRNLTVSSQNIADLCTTRLTSFPDTRISLFASSCSSPSAAVLLRLRIASPGNNPHASDTPPEFTCRKVKTYVPYACLTFDCMHNNAFRGSNTLHFQHTHNGHDRSLHPWMLVSCCLYFIMHGRWTKKWGTCSEQQHLAWHLQHHVKECWVIN